MAEEKPKKRIWDKLLMGAIIGGAIGSVVGASIASKKGKETRKEIAEAIQNTKKGSKIFFQKLKAMFSFGKNKKNIDKHSYQHDRLKKIPHENVAKIEESK